MSEENKLPETEKMDLYQYEEKYVSHENYKNAATIIYIIVIALGVVVISCLLDIVLKLFELNQYVGYGAAVVAVILFIVAYVVPTAKLLAAKSFKVDVTRYNAAKAKRYNRQLRHEIAEKFIDYNKHVENGSWYSSEKLDAVELALTTKNEEALKTSLSAIFNTDVNKAAKDLIFKSSLRSGLYSAISQTDLIDASLVLVVNLQMMKDIVFLYGYRPTYPKLVKIYRNVMVNSLIAYGLGNVKIGSGVVKTMGDMAKGLPLLGSVISALVDSSVQGLSNATLTAIIGFNTIKVMAKEYRLQDILDGVVVSDTEKDLKETCDNVAKELKNTETSAAKLKKAQ